MTPAEHAATVARAAEMRAIVESLEKLGMARGAVAFALGVSPDYLGKWLAYGEEGARSRPPQPATLTHLRAIWALRRTCPDILWILVTAPEDEFRGQVEGLRPTATAPYARSGLSSVTKRPS